MKYQSLFCEKNKETYFKMSSAEIISSMPSVKVLNSTIKLNLCYKSNLILLKHDCEAADFIKTVC